jgi:hypothetical protein
MTTTQRMPTVTDAASAEAFVSWCVRTIGPGYHPDSRAADYEPPLPPKEARRYDEMHERAFRLLADVYAIALDEWRKTYG